MAYFYAHYLAHPRIARSSIANHQYLTGCVDDFGGHGVGRIDLEDSGYLREQPHNQSQIAIGNPKNRRQNLGRRQAWARRRANQFG